MDHFKLKNLWLLGALGAVEVANAHNVWVYYQFHEGPFPALLLAIGFAVMLIGSTLLFSGQIPGLLRALLVLGMAALMAVQATANVSMAFLVARTALPAADLARLWGMPSADAWLIRSSYMFGGVLTVVLLIFWLVLSVGFRNDEERYEREEDLIERMFKNRDGK